MEVLAFLLPFVLLGGAVLFISFSGGPSVAGEAFLMGGQRRGFRYGILLVYPLLGVVVPALILMNSGEAAGGKGSLEGQELTSQQAQGKILFRQQCASCHNLDAVNARGVTGPDLDEIGAVSKNRVVAAIANGGTGQDRMPKGLLEADEAEAVGAYLQKVASR
ncbi:MAG TPA: cytochrome c [Thermoleophilaceae bacterium]|nr:cytochrome c [Thermoleophilaceae bacterium]